MMLYGISPVHEALAANRREFRRLHRKEGRADGRIREIEALARQRKIEVVQSSIQALGNLSRTRQHQGVVLECGDLPTFDLHEILDRKPRSIVLLDQVEDPQNLGSIARSACFFGADALGVLRSKGAPLSAAASKASAGSLERIPVVRIGNLAQTLSELNDRGFRSVGAALDDEAIGLQELHLEGPLAIVLGNEGDGLRRLTRERCDHLVRIEGDGTESLNVSVAAGILLHALLAGGSPSL